MPSITFPSGSILTPTVLELSTNLASLYSTVCGESANWGNALPLDHSKWDATFDTVSTLSGDWNSVYSAVSINSGSWQNTYGTVSSLSSNWDATYALMSSNSANWDGAYATLNDVSASFGDSLTWVKNNSSTMYVDRLGVNTDINLLANNLKLAVQGDTVIYGNLSSLGTTTLVNVTANVTDALSVVNPGFGAPNAIFISQGGPGAGIKMNNAGSGPMMTLEGNGNVGIGTGTPNEKLTVNGNISGNGVIYASGGNSNLWNSSTTLFAGYSAVWQSNVVTTSSSSGRWNAAYSSLTGTSAKWDNTFNVVSSNSANWNSAYTNLIANSAGWNSIRSTVSAGSAKWDNTFNVISSNSANWNSAYTNLTANSGRWNAAYSSLTGTSAKWDNTFNVVSSNSANWNGSYNTINTVSSRWESNYNTTNSLSATWSNASINYIIDGGSVTVTTGSKGVIYMPSGFKVTSWRVMAETDTTARIDIRRFANNSYKTTSLSSDSLLLDKTNPEIRYLLSLNNASSAVGNGTTFRDISALDTLEFYVEENDFARRFTVALAGIKTS